MADKEVAIEISSDGNSNPTQPSQPVPSAAADASPSDPNLVSKVAPQPGVSRALFSKSSELIGGSNTKGDMGWS